MDIKVDWPQMRNMADITYIDKNGNYYLFANREQIYLVCVLDKESKEASEFEKYYKSSATNII